MQASRSDQAKMAISAALPAPTHRDDNPAHAGEQNPDHRNSWPASFDTRGWLRSEPQADFVGMCSSDRTLSDSHTNLSS
jgi:hypothetical protein